MNWTEAAIILGSVDLLFAFFVSIQFQYFFGGQANIKIEGFTYAEYAPAGFHRVVVVAVLSLLALPGSQYADSPPDSRPAARLLWPGHWPGLHGGDHSGPLPTKRLVLYEQAYGFSRLSARLYACFHDLAGYSPGDHHHSGSSATHAPLLPLRWL